MIVEQSGTNPGTSQHPRGRGGPRHRLNDRASYWLAAFLVVSGIFGSYSLSPLYPIYQERWHFSDLMLSIVFICYSLGTIVTLQFFGSLSDRFGRRATLLPALLGVAASMLMLAFAVNLSMLLVARTVQGVFTGIVNGTGGACLTDLAPRGDRRFAALTHSASIAVGSALGPLISGVLVSHAPLPLVTPYLLVLLLLAIGVAGVIVMPDTVIPAPRAVGLHRLRMPENRLGFFFACLGTAACSASMALYAEFGTPMAEAVHLHGASLGGLIVFIMFAAIGVAQLLLRRLHPQTALVSGTLVATVGWGGIACALFTHQPALMLTSTIVAGGGAGLAQMGGTATVIHVASPDRRAEAFSLYIVVGFCAVAGPGVGGGALSEAVHLSGTALVMLAATGIIAVVTYVTARVIKRSARIDYDDSKAAAAPRS
jgi:MFS family permease